MFQSLSTPRRRLLLGCLAALMAAVVAVAIVVVRQVSPTPESAAAQDQPGPILLVPGYGGGTGGLASLGAKLTAAGRDATVVDLPDGGTGDLHAQAQTLQTAVTAVMKRTGAVSVDIVGYSAGGIVARIWARDLGGAEIARRVLTLGSPHHGTQIAGLAVDLAPSSCPTACQQLAPDSQLLTTLNAGDETPDGPVYISIWTDKDQTVQPPDSAKLDGAVNLTVQSVCADSTVGHGQLPTDPTVSGIVLLELAGSAPPELTAADCTKVSS